MSEEGCLCVFACLGPVHVAHDENVGRPCDFVSRSPPLVVANIDLATLPRPLYVPFFFPSRLCQRREPGDHLPVLSRTPETNRARRDCVSCSCSSLTSCVLPTDPSHRVSPLNGPHAPSRRRRFAGVAQPRQRGCHAAVVCPCKRSKTGLVRVSCCVVLTSVTPSRASLPLVLELSRHADHQMCCSRRRCCWKGA